MINFKNIAQIIGFKKKAFWLIFISLFSINVYGQRDLKVGGYYIKTNRNTITYSLKSNPDKIYKEKLVSFDSLGIIFDNESFKPIHYSEFESFSFKPNNILLRQGFAVSVFSLLAINAYIHVSSDTYTKFLMPVSVVLWGAGVGLVSLTNAINIHKVTLHNLYFGQFKTLK
jgi:hypothetical protein